MPRKSKRTLMDGQEDMNENLRNLERRVTQLEQDRAVGAERHKALIAHLDRIDAHVSETKSDQKWTFRLVVGAIITAGIAFVVKGGLNIAG